MKKMLLMFMAAIIVAISMPAMAAGKLKITDQPAYQKIEPGLHKFIVKASQKEGTEYQWQVKEPDKKWRNFDEKLTSKTSCLWFTVTSDMDRWKFRCKVSNDDEKVVSDAFKIRVIKKLKFTSTPSDMDVKAGKLKKMKVKTNQSGVSYQWQVKEPGKEWRNFTEKQTAKKRVLWFTIENKMDQWKFRCVAKKGKQSITSKAFQITVE